MGHEHHGLAHFLVQPDDLRLHVAPDERIQRGEGFIEEDGVRIAGQGPAEAHALLHSPGQLVRVVLFVALEADQLDDFPGPGVAFILGCAADLQPVGDIVQHGAVRQEAEVLEHHGHLPPAQFPQLRQARLQDVFAIHEYLPGRGFDQPGQAADQGGFAGSGKPHDHENLALGDVEAQVPDGRHAAGAFQQFC